MQPPSGGCVLKLLLGIFGLNQPVAAAFGRLCVETPLKRSEPFVLRVQPPSGGCVLKPYLMARLFEPLVAAAFGRLCVETLIIKFYITPNLRSRLRAAVC